MRGLEERLRLALEGTETGFWEWYVATDIDRVVRQHGPAVRPPARDAARGRAGLPRPHRASRGPRGARRRTSRKRSCTARPTSSTCASSCPSTASAGCTPARAPSSRRGRHDASGSPACSPTSPSAATARRRTRSSTPPARCSPRSLDPVQTLEEVAQLAVPRLADWCAVQLAPDRQQVAVAHVDPDKVRWARELQDRYPPDPDSPTGAPAVIRSGRSELYPVIDSALLEAAALDEEQMRARARAADEQRDGRPARRARAHARRDHVRVGRVGPPVLHARARAGRGARPPRRPRARPRAAVRARAPRRRDAPARAAARHLPELAGLRARRPLRAVATRATTPAATGTTRSGSPTAASGS